MRSRLLWKIVAVNVITLAVIMVVVWVAVDYLAADYFTVLMRRYNISPADSHAMFVDAVHRYLVQGSLLALVLAVLLALLLTRQVLRPLSEMAEVARRVAAGDLRARVETVSRDEVGGVAQAFNRMTDSLEQMERLRRSMVTDIAHELRTPLTNARGYLEGLADGVVAPSKATFGMLENEIVRLVRLVEDLRRLIEADAAKAYLRRETLHLPDLVEHALAFQRHHFKSRGIVIATRFDPGSERVRGDRGRLLQVMRNLIENAWQYGAPGRRFCVIAQPADEIVEVTFASTGPPIAEADLPLLFERFHRAEKSRSRTTGGAGIGLAIVKGVIEAHGGKVGAYRAQDFNCFWFSLPR